MVTFTCPNCGQERTGRRRRCYPCTAVRHTPEVRARIRATLTGVPHTEERRRKASEAQKRRTAPRFDVGAFSIGKPAHNRAPIGYTRVSNGHMQVKCPDGKFRYRARVMWEAANGPIPPGSLIHHVNHDPFDDRLENFQLVTRSQHQRIHLLEGDRARTMGAKGLRSRYGR